MVVILMAIGSISLVATSPLPDAQPTIMPIYAFLHKSFMAIAAAALDDDGLIDNLLP